MFLYRKINETKPQFFVHTQRTPSTFRREYNGGMTAKSYVVGALKIFAGAAFVGLIVGGIYFVTLHSYYARLVQGRIGDFLASFSSPVEVRTALYLVTPQNGGASYARGRLDYSEYEKWRLTTDLVYEGDNVASVAYQQYHDLPYEVILNGSVISHSLLPTKSVAVSPSGNLVAFSRLIDAGLSPFLPQNWEAITLDLRTGVELSMGPAFSVFFLDDETVVRFTDGGVIAQKLDGSVIGTFAHVFTSPNVPVTYSYDRSHIAWAQDSETKVYVIERTDTVSLREESKFSTGFNAVTSLALSDSALYVVATDSKKGSTITNYPLQGGEPDVVRTFPSILAVAKMIL
jgi:hypothetical protein